MVEGNSKLDNEECAESVFLLVEGYHRGPMQSVGRVIATHAVTDAQLNGTVLRLIRTGANQVIVTEISEEVFAEFYQEASRHNAKQKDDVS